MTKYVVLRFFLSIFEPILLLSCITRWLDIKRLHVEECHDSKWSLPTKWSLWRHSATFWSQRVADLLFFADLNIFSKFSPAATFLNEMSNNFSKHSAKFENEMGQQKIMSHFHLQWKFLDCHQISSINIRNEETLKFEKIF